MAQQAKPVILVVDDNEASLYVKSRQLQRAGFATCEARTGSEALRMAAEVKPALTLLDVHLPDIDGLEVCRRLKSDPKLASIFVLQITASLINPEDRVEALNSGADSYLVEPVEPDELIATVRALLRLRDAEVARQQSEERYADLFVHASDMVFTLDQAGCFLTVNPAVERITEYTAAELIGRPFVELLNPQDLPTWEALFALRPAGWRRPVDELEILTRRSRRVTLEINSWLLMADGEIMGLQAIARDISERKRADELLRASEDRLRRVLDSLVAFAAVLTADGRILEVNRAALQVSDLHLEDVRGVLFEESYWFNYAPEVQQQIHDSVQRAANGETVRMDLQGRGAGGEFLDIDYAIAPVYDSEGVVRYLVPSAVDITERQRSAAQLRHVQQEQTELLALLESLLDNAPVGIAFFDRELHPVRINRQLFKMSGANLSEQEEQSAESVLTHLSDILPGAEKVFATGHGIYNAPLQVRTTTTTNADEDAVAVHHMLASWYPVSVGDEQSRYVGTTVVDITALRRYEAELQALNATLEQRVHARTAELERSNRELDQFAYVASHDLKAPLRAIDYLAQWITDDAAEVLPVDSQEHLVKLRGRIQRMDRLLDDLLAYSRIGRRDGQVELVDTRELVQDVLTLLAPSGIQITIGNRMPTIYTARAPLELVFRNLIGNAIKHHHRPQQGQVTIESKDLGDVVEFSVTDNGPGIEPQFHERIFGMFQTLRPRDEVEGSGMGLAMVKKALDHRGTSIEIESDVNQGATFRFTWPKEISPA